MTVPSGRGQSWFHHPDLLDNVAGRARVYQATGEGCQHLSRLLPDGTQVYGGAARLYPPGVRWTREPRYAPLRTARSADDASIATAKLLADLERLHTSEPKRPARAAVVTPEPASEPGVTTAPAAAESTTVSAEVQALRAELATQRARLVTVTNARDAARTELSRLRQAAQAARKGDRDPSTEEVDWSGTFSDPEEQFRFEVYLAWARRIPASQKADLPLGTYVIGPDFLSTLEQLEGIARPKVIDVVVEVLTGLARQQASRKVHVLRTSAVGGSTTVTRADGAVAWRVSLQHATASARRLHYWARPDGVIELARVGTHDDMTI